MTQTPTRNLPYGALAWSRYKHVTAAGLSNSKDGAIKAAHDNCATESGVLDCVTMVWFHNAVGALAESDNNHAGTGFGWAWNADRSPDIQAATKRARDGAIATCTAIGGTNCEVVYSEDAGTVAHGEGGQVPLPDPLPLPFAPDQQPNQPTQPKTPTLSDASTPTWSPSAAGVAPTETPSAGAPPMPRVDPEAVSKNADPLLWIVLPVAALLMVAAVGAWLRLRSRRITATPVEQVQARLHDDYVPSAPEVRDLGDRPAWTVGFEPHQPPIVPRLREG